MDERRVDPEDGKVYTLAELTRKYKGEFSEDEVIEFWEHDCEVEAGGDIAQGSAGNEDDGDELIPDPAERRVDPEDNRIFSFEEFKNEKQSQFPMEEIVAYWFDEMSIDLPDGTKVLVSNISEDLGEWELSERLGQVGKIDNYEVHYDSETNELKGFASFQYTTAQAAERAVKELSGMELGGQKLTVRHIFDKDKPTKVFVGCLSPETSLREVSNFFAEFGEVAHAQMLYDVHSSETKGQAKLQYIFPESVQKACTRYHRKMFNSKRIICIPWEEDDRGRRKAGPACFVQNLGGETTSEDLKKHFEAVVDLVVEVQLYRERRGLAKVELGDEESVGKAIDKLNGSELGSRTIVVRKFGLEKNSKVPVGVFVAGLSFNMTSDELRDLFSAAGEVVGVQHFTERQTGKSRGSAKVFFRDDQTARKAIEMFNGKEHEGRTFHVREMSAGSTGSGKGVSIFISALSPATTEEGLKDFFSSIGEVLAVSLFTDHAGLSKCCAKVEFASEAMQQQAVAECNGAHLDGRRIHVREFGNKGASLGPVGAVADKLEEYPIFVGCLNLDTDLDSLKAHFSEAGEVLFANIMIDRATGKSKGVAKVCFATKQAQRKAFEELNGSVLLGKHIVVRDFHSSAPPDSSGPKGHGRREKGESKGKGEKAEGEEKVESKGKSKGQKGESKGKGEKAEGEEKAESKGKSRGERAVSKGKGEKAEGEEKAESKGKSRGEKAESKCKGEKAKGGQRGGNAVEEGGKNKGKNEKGDGKGEGAKGKSRETYPIFVGSLSYETTAADVKAHFQKIGEVAYATVMVDTITGKSKGCARVSFYTQEAQQRALHESHGSQLNGRSILVQEYQSNGAQTVPAPLRGIKQATTIAGGTDRVTTPPGLSVSHMSLKDFLAAVDAQWLRHLTQPHPDFGVREFHEELETQFDSVEQILMAYGQQRPDGKKILKDKFFDDVGMKKLGHRRLVNKWVAANT